ncbi:MAG: hypothetical protein JNM34_02330 [Chthonomonadaceae bacterium]|nr:hypothetical protein [Chthonomonadaceae bacterium]
MHLPKLNVLKTVGIVFGVQCLSSAALAGWTVTNLHYGDAPHSYCTATDGGQQAGYIIFQGYVRPVVWADLPETMTGLPSDVGQAWAVENGQQVGRAVNAGFYNACVWSGPGGNPVLLHPIGAFESHAWGQSAGQQVGEARFGSQFEAGYWTGTAASWVSLHPSQAVSSVAHATNGAIQGGSVNYGTGDKACVWNGTAQSVSLLHPSGYVSSVVWAMNGGQQAGVVSPNVNGYFSASLWTGTVESHVDLHPAGYSGSIIYATDGSYQAGVTLFGGYRAAVWNGSASSFFDLHSLLPSSFAESFAFGVWSGNGTIKVAGFGRNIATGRDEALLWTFRDTETVVPSGVTVQLGRVTSGNTGSLSADDSDPLVLCKFFVPNQTSPFVQVVLLGTTSFSSPDSLSLRHKSKLLNSGAFSTTCRLYNFVSGAYEESSTAAIGSSYGLFSVTASGDCSRYVGQGGSLQAQLQFRQVGPSSSNFPCASIEYLNWIVAP